MDCVVLAGGVPTPGDTLYPYTMGLPKARVEVAGRTVGQWVIDALTDAGSIDRIVVVGDIEVSSPKLVAVVSAGRSLVDNFVAGVEALQGSPGSVAAACTSDIPLLTGTMVDWFVASSRGSDATAGVIRREAVNDHYPEYPNSYWRLTDGEFTAADFIVFAPSKVPGLLPRLRPLADARKNVIRTARLIGPGLLIRLLLRRLSLAQATRYISNALGIDLEIIDVPHPEMGLDVDEAAQLTTVRNVLERLEPE